MYVSDGLGCRSFDSATPEFMADSDGVNEVGWLGYKWVKR